MIFSAAFLLPLVMSAFRYVVSADAPLWWVVLALTLVFIYALAYLLFPLVARRSRPVNFAFCIGMVLLGLTLFALYGQSPYVILFATGVTMFSLPAAWALIIDIPAVLVIVAVLLVNGRFSGSLGNLIRFARSP
jgi:hypothetical protein